MSDDVEVVLHLPLPDMDALGLVLCDITKALHERDPEIVAPGFLGGSFGYGGNWSSPVFDMRPYNWGDCDCGAENRQGEWLDAHKHTEDCYQSEMGRALLAAGADQDGEYFWRPKHISHDKWRRIEEPIWKDLCRKHKLSSVGCAIHCTCYREKAYEAYEAANGCAPTCCTVLPNFRHHASGFEVRWYKYIGRGMETKGTPPDLRAMEAECIADVKAEGPR